MRWRVPSADAALERLVRGDSIEDQIADELAMAKPLAGPSAFPACHRTLARSLEVYDRNRQRAPLRLPAGVLRPVLQPVVGALSSTIAHAYQRRLLSDVRRLYVMREANSVVGSREHRMLTTARRQVDQMSTDLGGRGFAVPAFLAGGAALSAATSWVWELLQNRPGRLAMLALILIVAMAAFWCILMAASVTRRRTRLILDRAVTDLWECIGGAGEPPHDPSRAFVVGATILLVIGWVLAPIGIAVLSRLL